jgi:hypothetical protein
VSSPTKKYTTQVFHAKTNIFLDLKMLPSREVAPFVGMGESSPAPEEIFSTTEEKIGEKYGPNYPADPVERLKQLLSLQHEASLAFWNLEQSEDSAARKRALIKLQLAAEKVAYCCIRLINPEVNFRKPDYI